MNLAEREAITMEDHERRAEAERSLIAYLREPETQVILTEWASWKADTLAEWLDITDRETDGDEVQRDLRSLVLRLRELLRRVEALSE